MIGVATVLRLFIDRAMPGVVPYMFIFPAIAGAVMIAGPRAGLLTLVGAQALTWYAVVPVQFSFRLASQADGLGLLLSTLSELVLLGALSAYRAAVQHSAASAAARVATSQLAMRELDHRTRNNLQMIQSVLYLKAQRVTSDEAKRELAAAAARIGIVASMNTNIARSGTDLSHVALQPYLGTVCRHLSDSLCPEGVVLTCDVGDCGIDSDRALYLGLIVNELVTNAIKYAFPDKQGQINVMLHREQDMLVLVVADNGCGKTVTQPADGSGREQGLGTKLVQMMVGRIRATMQELEGPGTGYRIDIPA